MARQVQTNPEFLAGLEQHSHSIVGSMAISGFAVSEETRRRAVQQVFERIKSGELARRIQESQAKFSTRSEPRDGGFITE